MTPKTPSVKPDYAPSVGRTKELRERLFEVRDARAISKDEYADLFSILDDYAALKAENERLVEREKQTETYWRNAQTYGMKMERSRNALRGPLAQLKARAEKAEAERDKFRNLSFRWQKSRADLNDELERQRPLIESSGPAEIVPLAVSPEEGEAIRAKVKAFNSAPSPAPLPKEVEVAPENNCHRCGGKNLLCWYADNDVWNAVMRPGDGPELFDGIVCPRCFTILAGQNGIKPIAWRLSKEGDDAEIDKLRVEIHRLKEGPSAPFPKEVEEAMRLLADEAIAFGTYPSRAKVALAVIKAALQPKKVSREQVVSILAEAGGNIGITTERAERAIARFRELGIEVEDKP